jgi:hypothetical protein
MASAITNTDGGVPSIVFREITSDKPFNAVYTSVVLKTRMNKVVTQNEVELLVDGSVEGKSNTLLVVDESGNVEKREILEEVATASYSDSTQCIIKPNYGVDYTEVLSPYITHKTIKYSASITERGVSIGTFYVYLDNGSKAINVMDLATNDTVQYYTYRLFSYVKNMFSDRDYIYFTCYKYSDRIFRFKKSSVLLGLNINTDIETIYVDKSNTSITLYSSYADHIVHKNYVFFASPKKPIAVMDLETRTAYHINGNLKLSNYKMIFFEVEDDVYLVDTYGRNVYRLTVTDGVPTQELHFSHSLSLSTSSKSYVVIGKKIVSLEDNKVLDLEAKKGGYASAFFPKLSYLDGVPFIYNGAMMVIGYTVMYKAPLQLDKVSLIGTTNLVLDQKPTINPYKVTKALDLEYIVTSGNTEVPTVLETTTCLLASEMIVNKFVSRADGLTSISQKLIIGKNAVYADKLITHCYEEE